VNLAYCKKAKVLDNGRHQKCNTADRVYVVLINLLQIQSKNMSACTHNRVETYPRVTHIHKA